MKKNNLISILITNYNKEKFLEKCLDSVYKQKYKKFEVILYDDCSSDNSLNIINRYKKIKLIKNLKRKKKSSAINQIVGLYKAFKKSKGSIICLLDGDDSYKKNKLFEINKFFSKYQKFDSVFDIPITAKKKFKLRKNSNLIWPTIIPTSCISVKKNIMNLFFKNIKKNSFQNLEIDARFTIFTYFYLGQYNILEKKLSYYNHDKDGITSNIKKFSKKWWFRRSEAFAYLRFVLNKKKKKFIYSIDFFLTCIIAQILKR